MQFTRWQSLLGRPAPGTCPSGGENFSPGAQVSSNTGDGGSRPVCTDRDKSGKRQKESPLSEEQWQGVDLGRKGLSPTLPEDARDATIGQRPGKRAGNNLHAQRRRAPRVASLRVIGQGHALPQARPRGAERGKGFADTSLPLVILEEGCKGNLCRYGKKYLSRGRNLSGAAAEGDSVGLRSLHTKWIAPSRGWMAAPGYRLCS